MKKDELSYEVIVPSSGKTSEKNGNIVAIDEGSHMRLYIGHRTIEVADENGEVAEAIEAYPIRVEKPITRDRAINAAEMQAYRLATSLDVASFGTSLGRKYRENPEDLEVIDHDDFIRWIKQELTKIGV